MTETDITKRLEQHVCELGHTSLYLDLPELQNVISDAHGEITRLRKRVEELEYRERSRECVYRGQAEAVLSPQSASINADCREAMTKARDGFAPRPDAVKILRERASDCAKKAISWGHSGHRSEFAVLSAVADAPEQERKG